jgi:hypothetical protein
MSVNRREFWQWDPENVKRCDKSVSQGKPYTSHSFIATRARQDALVAIGHVTLAMKQPEEFHVFH